MTETQTAPAAAVKPPTPNLNKALSQLQGKLPKIPKGNHVQVEGKEGKRGYKYDYADLADVAQAVGPLLAEFGLAFTASPTINPADPRMMILDWSLVHESGEERSGYWPLGPVSTPPQTLGSAITYGRRYCLGASTGIVTEDDDDGQRAQQDHGRRQSAGDMWDQAAPARPQPQRQERDGHARGRNGNGAANGDRSGQSQRPASSGQDAAEPSGAQESIPVPPPLDPADSWAQVIADIKTPEDADAAEAELKRAWEAGEIDDQRTHQVKHWLLVKAAPMRTAAQSAPRANGSAPADPQGDSEWIAAFVAEIYSTPLDGLTALRGRIGRAVAERKITPDEATKLSAEIIQHRRQLEQETEGAGTRETVPA